MQDDVYELVVDGWEAGKEVEKDPKKRAWEGRMIPKVLMVNRYFDADKKAIEKLESACDDIARRMEEMEEEHSGDEGLLEEAKNEKGKLNKAGVQECLHRISQRLTGRIKELAERYDETLPGLEDDVEKMEKKVKGHLAKMGFKV